jgi:hypothetical protein
MHRWASFGLVIAIAASGCGGTDIGTDAGGVVDAGRDGSAGDAGRDAHVGPDADLRDTGIPDVVEGGLDAFAADDAGGDAFVSAVDAGTDAFVADDAGHDAWVMPTCTDGTQNGDETDRDCGGTVCPACASGQMCLAHTDCATGACDLATLHCSITCTAASAPGATCNDYCDCMAAACTFFADRTACLNACGSFDAAQLCCRTQHCGLARIDPAFHCPHAEGMSTCP